MQIEKDKETGRYRVRLFWDSSRKGSYVKPKVPGEIKGKLNLKRAKRERVKALKAQQA